MVFPGRTKTLTKKSMACSTTTKEKKNCKETEREKTRDTGMVKAWWPSHIKLCMRD